jgi:hypothetical protein
MIPSPLRWIALIWVVLVLSACRADPPPLPPPTVTGLTIDAPTQWHAGEEIPLRVTAQAPDGTSLFLIAHGTFGSLPLAATFDNGEARLRLPAAQTRTAGIVDLLARAGDQSATARLELIPGEPVDPILPLVGPRSIRVGGEEWTMVVAIPMDAHANPVADGVEVIVRAQHPEDEIGGAPELQRTHTDHLFAWARIFSRTRAGRTLLAVNAGAAHSPERDVMEVPDLPIPFDLTAEPAQAEADGRRLVTITSTPLLDRYGNVLLDGVAALFIVQSEDGSRRAIPANVREGRLRTTIQAPAQADQLILYADVAGLRSRSIVVPFVAAAETDPLPLTLEEDAGGVTITVGPLLGALGQFSPDGAPVEFWVVDPNGEESRQILALENGYARLTLPTSRLLRGRYQITAWAGARTARMEWMAP